MKISKFIYIIIWYISSNLYVFAEQNNTWLLWTFRWNATETEKAIREWDIHLSDIPVILKSLIDFLMWIAWTIAIIFIIIWAYKILFGSLEQDKTKWKDTIIMALWGFILASFSWFIIKFIIDNLS